MEKRFQKEEEMSFKKFLLENSSSTIGGIPYYIEDDKVFFAVMFPSDTRPETVKSPQIALKPSNKISPEIMFETLRELLGIERKSVQEFYKVYPNYSAISKEDIISENDSKSHIYAVRVEKGVAIRKTEPEVLRVIWLNELLMENFREDQVELMKEIISRIKKHHGLTR